MLYFNQCAGHFVPFRFRFRSGLVWPFVLFARALALFFGFSLLLAQTQLMTVTLS